MVKRYALNGASPFHVTSLSTATRPEDFFLNTTHWKCSPGAIVTVSIFAVGNCSMKAG